MVPYSAIQLCTYELAKRRLRDAEGNLSVPARLAAGACAGMTATLVTSVPLREASEDITVASLVGSIMPSWASHSVYP